MIKVKYINKAKTGSKKIRLIGNSTITIDVDIKKYQTGSIFLVLTSDWCKENKILAYPDIIKSKEAQITLANISGYFKDIEHDTIIAHLYPIDI